MPVIAFLTAVAYAPFLYSGPIVLRWAVIAIGVPLASRLDPREVAPWPLTLLTLFVLWSSAGVLVDEHRLAGSWDLAHLLMLSAAFIAAASLPNLDRIMIGFALGIALSTIAQAAQMGGWDGLPRWGGGLPGLFYNREALALAAAPVAVYAALRRWWGLAAFTGAAVALTGSRLGLFATAFGIALAVRRWPIQLLVLAAVIGAGIASLSVLGPERVLSAAQRFGLWNDAMGGSTLAGHGLGSWLADYPVAEFAHSDALQSLYETGWIGGALLFFLYVTIAMQEADDAEMGAFSAVAVTAVFSFPLHLPASGFMAAVVAGHLARRGAVVRVVEPDLADDRDNGLPWPDEPWGNRMEAGPSGGDVPDRPTLAFVARRGKEGDG